MIEENLNPHVVVITPPSVFDAAVILRTLYAGLGVKEWRLTIVGLGKRIPLRLVVESRTPVEVLRANVSTELEEPSKPVYVVDPRGEPAWSLPPPSSLVIDYSGTYSSRLSEAKRVRSLGLNSLTYEAIGIIYEYWIRRLARTLPRSEPYSRDIRSGVYIARKSLEAITVLDNYIILEPSTIVYTLRKIYLSQRAIIDPKTTAIRISHVNGLVREEIEATMYSAKGYSMLGSIKIVYTSGILEIMDNKGLAYRILIDPARRRACSAPGLCVSLNTKQELDGLKYFVNQS